MDAVWGYIQTDVLSTEFHTLVTKVADVEAGFEGVQEAHVAFLGACLRGCFLGGGEGKVVGAAVREGVGACEVFCGIVGRVEGGGKGVEGEVRRVGEEFDQHSLFLFRVLSGVQDTQHQKSGSHLDALLLRLDQNLFYSLSA
ncbi:Gamma-tubulin complex component 4 [Podochytrium sp. JEL0797]|nr:Gamma-tubulin complex component 4 [Podochytrium sp. JEL0797]